MEHPNALVIAHPECPGDVLAMADFIGSTSAIIHYCVSSPAEEFIVMTESGVNHSLTKLAPGKKFYYVQERELQLQRMPVHEAQHTREAARLLCVIWSREWRSPRRFFGAPRSRLSACLR